MGRKILVEVVVLVFFGFSENFCLMGGSFGYFSLVSFGGGLEVGKSFFGSFFYEMYYYLVKKVISFGGEWVVCK